MKKLLILAALPMLAQAEVPHTFTAGQAAKAAEVNANFQALDQAMVTDVLVSYPINSGESLAVADCPAGSAVVSAGCFCDDNDGAANFGVLLACLTGDNAALAGCVPEAITYNSQKGDPIANVVATCMELEGATAKAAKSANTGAAVEAIADKIRRQAANYRAALDAR